MGVAAEGGGEVREASLELVQVAEEEDGEEEEEEEVAPHLF